MKLTGTGAISGIEETEFFTPAFDGSGLIPAIVSDAASGQVLMFAFMNELALTKTIATGYVHFWSRSRKKLWRKGESSGETLLVKEILTDCDQDVLNVTVELTGRGATCHTGRRSCFYRALVRDGPDDGPVMLRRTGAKRLFDPEQVYRGKS